jgi:hypothetical protein
MKTAEEIETWADAYIAYRSRDSASADDPLWWAVNDFMNMEQGGDVDPEDGWQAILLILQKQPPEEVIALLAAGPLEDLIEEFGDQFIGRIEIESRQNPSFRHLLGGVWKSGSDEVWRRVQKAQGTLW